MRDSETDRGKNPPVRIALEICPESAIVSGEKDSAREPEIMDKVETSRHAPLTLAGSGSEIPIPDPDRTVAVLMSGGVDSSVTAYCLKQEGWQVLGVTMRIPDADPDAPPRPCCGQEAAAVCAVLGAPHILLDTTDAFRASVIDPFRDAYASGRTPSPCIDCNRTMKFGAVWDTVTATFGVRHLATGHYARIVEREGAHRLMQGEDPRRDQSYFLYGIRRTHLPFLHFPVGHMTKEETRTLARRANLPTATRQDSMDLCFVGGGDYRNALARNGKAAAGLILDEEGRTLGTHGGIWNFTPGQRKGLGVAARAPLYVLRLDVERNAVIVGGRERVYRHVVRAEGVNWHVPVPPARGSVFHGRIRSAARLTPCVVDLAEAGRMWVRFEEPVFAPAAGQHLVLYDGGGCVVGGGVIQPPSDAD